MSGIALLRRLLLKQAMKKSAPFQHEGIMSINKNLVNDVERQVSRWVDSAKRQGADIDKMSEQELKYVIELNKPKGPMIGEHRVIDATSPEGKEITESLFGKKPADVLDLTGKKIDTSKPILGGKNVELTHNEKIDWLVKNVSPTAEQTIPPRPALEQMLKDGREDLIDHFFEMHTKKLSGKPKINIDTSDLKHPELVKKMMTDEKLKPTLVQGDIVTETITTIKSKKPIDAMKEANSVIGRKGKYKNLTKEQSKKILKDTEDHIFERDIKPDSEDFAGGGIAGMLGERTGYETGLKVYPKIKGSREEIGLGNGFSQTLQNLIYGGTIMGEKDGLYGGIEGLKIKNKIDFILDNQTLFKDTTDDEKINFIIGKKGKYGDIRLKTDKDLENAQISYNWKFAGGGLAGMLGEPTYEDDNHRVPYGLGGGFNAARRAFLKIMGAGAAGTVAAKSGLFSLLKGGGKKQVIKELTSVPINNIDGMPLWFKPFVNKVIAQGDDVTKKFAEAERQIVHKTKLPDSQTDVLVTQDLGTGDVVVDIGMGKHGFKEGLHGQPVRLEYKAGEWLEPSHAENIKRGLRFEKTGKPKKTKDEFWVEEAEFTGGHPENVKFEDVAYEKFGQHGSNFDEVEKFATGAVKKIKKASGGRVPLSGGLLVKGGNWFLKSLRGTREAIKNNKEYSPERIKQYLNQIDNEIKNIESGGKIPDEVIQTIRSDPKFKGVWQNQKSLDPDLREIEEVLLEYGQKHAEGGRASLADGKKVTDPGYFMFQDVDEDRPFRYEYDASNPEHIKIITDRLKKKKQELIEAGLLEQKIFSEKDRIPADNYFLESIQNFPTENTPEELEEIKRNLRLKQELKEGGRASLSAGGLAGMLGE